MRRKFSLNHRSHKSHTIALLDILPTPSPLRPPAGYIATPLRMSFFFAALCAMSAARLTGGAHVIWVGMYRF